MKINLLLRSLADGTHTVLPLDHVLAVDTQDILKAKILRDYPPLSHDGEFFLAFNGTYLENISEENGATLTLADYGIEENSMIQIIRLEEIIAQQEQEAAAGNPEALAAFESLRHSGSGADGTNVDLHALAFQASNQHSNNNENSLNNTVTGGNKNNNNKKGLTTEEAAQAQNDLKSYKSKARRNKWRIRAELLPNDGGKTKVTVHDRQYDKLECYVHALLYDYQDPATWAALGATLQHPLATQKTVSVPVQGTKNNANSKSAINEDGSGPDDVEISFNQNNNNIEQKTQQFTATECFTISLRLDPMNAQTWVMLGACLAGDLSQSAVLLDRDMNRADCFARAAELDPLYPRAWYNLALCLLENTKKIDCVFVGSSQETVESCLLRVLQSDPRHAGSWVSLGLLLIFAFDNPDNDVVSMGEESYDRKACLIQALRCDPKQARAWYNLGVCLPPPHYFAEIAATVTDPRERELKEQLRYVQIQSFDDADAPLVTRIQCFEKAVRYKPRAAHHWVALATELPLDQRTVPFPDCPPLAKWDCFAKALDLDPKNSQAWCGLGQALLSAKEKGLELPTKYKSFELGTAAVQGEGSSKTLAPSSFASSLLGPDMLTPKHCFECALNYRFKMGRAWMSLVYVLGKDYIAQQEAVKQFEDMNPNASVTVAPSASSPLRRKSTTTATATIQSKNPPSARIHGKEYSLKECATYNVENNPKDARAWGNLAATLTKFNEPVFIKDLLAAEQEQDGEEENGHNTDNHAPPAEHRDKKPAAAAAEQKYFKIEILQQAITLDRARGSPCAKWWMDIALCMSDPGSSQDFDPRPDRILVRQQSLTKYDCIEKALEMDSAIARAWFELANHWSTQIRGESVATQRAFHDFSLIDLLVRAIALDSKNAQSWMLLANTIKQLNDADKEQREREKMAHNNNSNNNYNASGNSNNDNNDEDEGEVTMEVDGTVHSFRSTVQRALECDKHLPRGWQLLSQTFKSNEKTILVGGKLFSRPQCIVKALEENDNIEGSGQFGLPPTDEEEQARKERLHQQRHSGNFKREEEPFTDEELFSLWHDLAKCLLQSQITEIQLRGKQDDLLHVGCLDVRQMLEDVVKKGNNSSSNNAPSPPSNFNAAFGMYLSSDNNVFGNINTSSSASHTPLSPQFGGDALFQLLPGIELVKGELFVKILWASQIAPTTNNSSNPKNNNKNNNNTLLGVNNNTALGYSPSDLSSQNSGTFSSNAPAAASAPPSKHSEIFFAETAFTKALNIFNTSGPAWYGLARSIGNDHFVTILNGKWNKQSCLEKALTFDDSIKDAWIDLGQILPDDARTGCAYVSMQRTSRQTCYENALMIDLAQYPPIEQEDSHHHDASSSFFASSVSTRHPAVSEQTKSETAKLWCLFGSSLKAGVWVTLNGEALDQQRCFYKALALNINCEEAWSGLGLIALESSTKDSSIGAGQVKIPIRPSKTIEVNETDNDDQDDDNDNNGSPPRHDETPVPAALKLRRKKKAAKEPKFVLFSAAECFERAMDCKFLRGGGDLDDLCNNEAYSSSNNNAGGDNNDDNVSGSVHPITLDDTLTEPSSH